jgi:hypothetical protein
MALLPELADPALRLLVLRLLLDKNLLLDGEFIKPPGVG